MGQVKEDALYQGMRASNVNYYNTKKLKSEKKNFM